MARDNRKYAGNIEPGPDWMELGRIGPIDDLVWYVGAKTKPNAKGWRTIKVSVIGIAEIKANYWVTWNGERLARSKELGTMANHRPELYYKFTKMIEKLPPLAP